MTTTEQTQSGIGDFETTDSGTMTNQKPITQRKVIGAFGSGGDIGEYDLPNSTVGDDEVVMWFPDRKTAPLDITISELTESDSWEKGKTEFGEDEEIDVYVLEAGEYNHVLPADKVDTLADAVDTPKSELLNRARTKSETRYAENYPVLFEMAEGNVLIAPLIRDRSEITFPDE